MVNESSSASWRRHMAAVCRRLQHIAQEAEQILTPSTELTPVSSSSIPIDRNNSAELSCTLAQAMEALQRYRSGCTAAMLEMDALQQHRSRVSSPAPTPIGGTEGSAILCSPTRSTHRNTASEEDNSHTSRPSPAKVVQPHHRRDPMKACLTGALSAESQYMHKPTLHQQLGEREGVMGEYMWSARPLVEHEAEERMHLVSLWGYLVSCASMRQAACQAQASAGLDSSAAELAAHVHAAAPPLHPSVRSDTAAAYPRSIVQSGTQPLNLSQSIEPTHIPPHAQQQNLQDAQKLALAQLVARHDAEKTALETHLHAAQEEAAHWKNSFFEVKQALAAAQSATGEVQRCAGVTYDGMHRQLRDTTKKMWQLQLANDLLDTKVRVLSQELEELRLSGSLAQGRPQSNETASSAADLASGWGSQSIVGTANLSKGKAGSEGGGHHSCFDDARCRQLFASSYRSHTNGAAGSDGRSGCAQSVSPGVWIAYEERSSLLTTTTPVKPPSPGTSRSCACALSAERRAKTLQLGSSPPAYAHLPNRPPAWIPAGALLPQYDNKDGRHEGLTHERGDGDKINETQHPLFERTVSPALQLSLEYTPAPQPSSTPLPLHSKSRSDAKEAEAHPSRLKDVAVCETSNGFDSATHPDFSRVQQNAAGHSPSASAQTAVFEPRHRVTPPLHPDPSTILDYSQTPSNTECDGGYQLPLTVPHGVIDSTSDKGTASETDAIPSGLAKEEVLRSSLASSPSLTTGSGLRARLEAVHHDILYHAERLEQEVQALTSRHDAARRQRRRDRETLRVNASLHSADDNPESEALNRALEKLHIEQEEDDDELTRYYMNVNQKRAELERCLRCVENRLASWA